MNSCVFCPEPEGLIYICTSTLCTIHTIHTQHFGVWLIISKMSGLHLMILSHTPLFGNYGVSIAWYIRWGKYNYC